MSATADATAEQSGTFQLGDRTVHRLGFGAMRIVGKGVWGEPEDRRRSLETVRLAMELGVDLIDTADSYGPNVSEEIIREALHPYPAGLTIATKGGFTRSGPGAWSSNIEPVHLRKALEGSLQRLGQDAIDVYQLHNPGSGGQAYTDALGVIGEFQQEGLVKNLGLSNVSVAQVEEARTTLTIVSVQNPFNVESRDGEDVLDYCDEHGIGFIPYFPLSVGKLAEGGSGLVADIARAHDATVGQIALAWLLRRSPVILPIPGTGSPEHLRENVGAAGVQLTDEEFQQIQDAH